MLLRYIQCYWVFPQLANLVDNGGSYSHRDYCHHESTHKKDESRDP